MNMCFGTKNTDKYCREEKKSFVGKAPCSETYNDCKAKCIGVKSSENHLRDETKKSLEAGVVVDKSTNSETNTVRTISECIDAKSSKFLPEERKKSFVSDGSTDEATKSKTDIDRKIGSVGATNNSNKFHREETKRCVDEATKSETDIDRKIGSVGATNNSNIINREEMKKCVEARRSNDESSTNNEANIERKIARDGEKSSNKLSREARKKCSETEKFFGDGLSLRMDTNERDIEVTGDGCRLTMATNRGRIRMIGDGCRLQIGKNSGDIVYTGDGGRVSLGAESTGTKVQYIGEGGRVDIAECPSRSSFRNSTTSVSGTSTTGRKLDSRRSEDVERRSAEIVDNILNERRARQSSRTTCKTVRIVNGSTKIVNPTRTKNSDKAGKTCNFYS